MTGYEAWVTFANNNEEAIHVLVLAHSLKLALTTKKIVAFVKISSIRHDLKCQLDAALDMIINADVGENGIANVAVQTTLQIFRPNLCEKCVFISPSSLVLKNCDDVFDENDPGYFFGQGDQLSSSLFAYRPSIELWNNLRQLAKENPDVGDNGIDYYLKIWMAKFGHQFSLPDCYFTKIGLNDFKTKFPDNVKIVKLDFPNPLVECLQKSVSMDKVGYSGVQTFLRMWMQTLRLAQPQLVEEYSRRFSPNIFRQILEKDHAKDISTADPSNLKRNAAGDIAVIGMSCKFPGADNVDEFWKLIIDGEDSISEVPEDRWNTKEEEFSKSRGGFLKSDVAEFDGKFFGISPREAQFIDPQQRMLLELSWEALEHGGINPLSLKGSNTGVFMGIWRNDYEKLILKEVGQKEEIMRDYMGNSFAAASARLSYFLGLTGSNVATDSGCSSSMVSVHLACDSLRKGESQMAIAGGINLLIKPFNKMSMEHILAADGRCKTFDAEADGFGRAEGCGILVLKKLSHAIRDGDNVQAIIRGSGISQEGTSNSFGTPSKDCQALAIKRALWFSRVDPLDVSYVEAHGTGTVKGDPIEFAAISEMYGKGRIDPLIIGSVKTNIGHTESAAGVAALVKVILALNKGVIPPHRNLNQLNPLIDLESVPAIIPNKPVKWGEKQGNPRIAGVSSFGISGTNVHILVEEAGMDKNSAKYAQMGEYERPQHILTINAKTKEALDELVAKYKVHLERNEHLDIADFCFTANSGRAHFSHRIALMGSSQNEILLKLQKGVCTKNGTNLTGNKKIAFLFPGQGAQYAKMGKVLYDTHPVFRDSMDYCADVMKKYLGMNLLEIIFDENENELLHESINSQTGIFCIEYSLLKLWESFGIKPDLVIGHSLGEFAAAFAAGILSFEELVNLLYLRTFLISNLPSGGMLAVKCGYEKLKPLIDEYLTNNANEWIDLACINSPEQVVLSAKKGTIANFASFCKDHGIKNTTLASHHAYHSRDMDSILSEYFKVAAKLNHLPAKCQYVSGMSGDLMKDSEINAEYWVDHCRNSVDYLKAIQTAVSEGCNIFIEIGPQPVLLNLGMQCIPRDNISVTNDVLWLPSMKAKENNWKTLLDTLSQVYVNGYDIDWAGFDFPYKRKKLTIPTYPFQRQKYWFETKDNSMAAYIGNGNLLHPLVGNNVNLSIPEYIYQNIIDLEKLSYLVDHQVANRIILPCAGMLEMVLAAGYLTLHNFEATRDILTPMVIQDFKISSPFEVGSDTVCLSEVVVKPFIDESFTGYSIKLHRKIINCDSQGFWKEYAVGKFSPTVYSGSNKNSLDFARIKNSCEEFSASEMYSKLYDIGLTFGTAFQSLTNIWQNSNDILAQVDLENKEQEKLGDYFCHPILIDAMIQIFFLGPKNLNSVHLPISVDKFILITRTTSKTYFVHTKLNANQDVSHDIMLYDEMGTLLAIMQGVSLVKTSVTSFINSLDLEKRKLPGMFEDVWRNQSGNTHSANFDFHSISNVHLDNSDFSTHMENVAQLTRKQSLLENTKFKICYLHIANAFVHMEWSAKQGETINHINVLKQLGVQSFRTGVIMRFFEILAEEGILKLRHRSAMSQDSRWEVLQELPSSSDINSKLAYYNKFIYDRTDEYDGELGLLNICGEKLDKILQGNQSPLELLFPENKNIYSAERFYLECISCKRGQVTAVKYVEALIHRAKELVSSGDSFKIRILEIGAGTGGTSTHVFPMLESSSIPYHYTYTDISSTLLAGAKTKFVKYSENIEYKLLNIENDPLNQNFAPHQFDIIIASNVLHATKNLRETVTNCRTLLSSGGHLVIFETLTPERCLDILFGVLDGYWRFEDFSLRPFNTLISGNTWCTLLNENGFSSSTVFETSEQGGIIVAQATEFIPRMDISAKLKRWIIISEKVSISTELQLILKDCGRHISVMPLSKVKQDFSELIDNLTDDCIEGIIYLGTSFSNDEYFVPTAGEILNISQILLKRNLISAVKFVVVTKGIVHVGDQNPKCPSDGIYWGFIRTLKNENPNMTALAIDLDPNDSDNFNQARLLISEIFTNNSSDFQVAFRSNNRYVLRLSKLLENTLVKLPLPNSERFTIRLPESRSIQDLVFVADQNHLLAETDVEIKVKATSLNFRDVFVILKPEGFHVKANSIGLDFSGVISDVGANVIALKRGDPVFGLSFEGALSSHVCVSEDLITLKPERVSFAEAAAISAVFATSIYCLEYVAKLTNQDTVLIHVASGGVGLCAIQIAKQIGAKIIATAGSKRKRAYLHSLGIEQVFDSRSTSYGECIRSVCSGVDVVINSLTGPNFKETTLSVCRKDARFIEIGKVGIWQPDEVFSLRPDVNYTIVDLEQVDSKIIQQMLFKISRFISDGTYKPLPVVNFDGRDIRGAFTYFQKALHIGKIVITIPNVTSIDGKIKHVCPIFNGESTYLITGGLGGIGLELTKFMVEYGAKHIVLVNRSYPNADAQKTIKTLIDIGARVHAFQFDVGNYEECEKLFDVLKDPKYGLPPLRGVMHAAGVLSDGIIPNQSVQKFETVFHPKVNGAWNLHLLTKEFNLEHFVMFSSVAALLSILGQSNHSAANSYLDTLSAYRNSIGLVGTSVNWGAWSQVGAASNIAIGTEGAHGVTPFSPLQGLHALKFILRKNVARAAVINLDVDAYKVLYPSRRPYLEEISSKDAHLRSETPCDIMDSEIFGREFINLSQDSPKLIDFVKSQIEIMVKRILKLNDDESLDENQNFVDMGLDSLMTIELKNKVQYMLGNKVSLQSTTFEDFPTIKTVTGFIITQYETKHE